jgi:cyclopropane-fatty-acyl-phospholipid synthase
MGRFARGTSRLLREMDRLLHRKRRNTRQNALRNIQAHYDLSNDLYAAFLDPDLNYSSAIFRSTADTLAQAQIHKLDRVIAQLRPGPDDHVLEIGSGWGACAIRMARETGCRVTSITLSHQQAEEARRRVAAAGLSDRVEIRLQDYRDVEGTFDHVVSLEMIEAVGHDFLPGYFRMLDQRLREGGLVLLQAITIPDDRYESYHRSVDFIRKHIFPGGHLPCPRLLEELRERETRLRLVDTFEFARDYAETLRRWRYQFFARLDQVRALGFDDAFIRKWQFYLSYCEAGFDTGLIHVHQLCYEKSRRD